MIFRKIYIIFFIFLILVTIARSFFLMSQLPFLDEAIYVNLASGIAKTPTLNDFLFPFEAGLSPLFIYFTAIAIKLFHNPFFSGRFTSLFISFLTTISLFLFLKKLKAKNILLTLLFFYFNPFTWIYSQMAMLETTMMFFAVLFLLQTEKVMEKPTRTNIFLLSVLLFFVILSKYTGFFIVIYFFAKCLFRKKYGPILIFIVFVSLIFLCASPILSKLFSTFWMHSERKQLFQINLIKHHFHLIFIWIKDYFQFLILFVIGIIGIIDRKKAEIKIAFFITIVMILFFALGATNLFPRYIYLIILMFCLILSFSKNKILHAVLFLLIVIYYFPTNYKIMFNLKNADIAKEDVYQYATDWTSGKNIMNIFKNSNAINKTVCVVSHDYGYFSIVKRSFFENKNIILQMDCKTQINYTAQTFTE